MAQRSDRLREEIKKEVSDILQKKMRDPRLGFVSITDVEVSRDLSYGKIYVSVFGKEHERKQTMEGLKKATGYIRTELGKRIRVRHVPELSFAYDQSLERGAKINEILRDLDTGGDNS